jgi:hypothetical protein
MEIYVTYAWTFAFKIAWRSMGICPTLKVSFSHIQHTSSSSRNDFFFYPYIFFSRSSAVFQQVYISSISIVYL